jgi:hypothetical protein
MSSRVALALAIYGTAGLFLIGVVVIFELQKTPKWEAEMIERDGQVGAVIHVGSSH